MAGVKMPEQDKTGPRGQGSLTGKGLGPCGRGLGFRRGFCLRTQSLSLTKEQERKILEAELVELEAEKTEIEKGLKKLKS